MCLMNSSSSKTATFHFIMTREGEFRFYYGDVDETEKKLDIGRPGLSLIVEPSEIQSNSGHTFSPKAAMENAELQVSFNGVNPAQDALWSGEGTHVLDFTVSGYLNPGTEVALPIHSFVRVTKDEYRLGAHSVFRVAQLLE
eukprot:Trichotokara_eunicae@DN5818_c0_g1_i1.p1